MFTSRRLRTTLCFTFAPEPEKTSKSWLNRYKKQLQTSISKSAYMLIEKLVRGPTIKWGTQSIKRTRTIKYLRTFFYENLNWAAHIKHQDMKAVLTHQRMAIIVGEAWGLKQEHRRILYSTVAERMILYGAAA
ncbi:hypothetical protein AVEN_59436-1 [Araneus ventricosus]|uniref:Uncharacterized protein n=1 Tax=Araneus ventricosus TaxID=182803 RepID=A0A4Y2MF84_ARAVE|nr:hypothetical protein AVEN_59436-1 [Araneus ventricosus]